MSKIQRIGDLERKYVLDVLNGEFKSSLSSTYMKRFESAFAARYGKKFAISCINGTATMHASLEAYGIGHGDEVIVPPLTMSATTFAVLQCNATPIFADVDLKTFQISPKDIEKNITEKTKAIITVSLYGLSPEMDEILEIARKYNLKVIEDNAECFLGEYKGNLVGTMGDCASFSFQSSKHLTSGEGGIILTDDETFADNVRRVQSLGYASVGAKKGKISKHEIQSPSYFRHVSMGWNYRMPELCCAVALAQTENIDALVEQRILVANIFSEETYIYSDWFTPQFVPSYSKNSYWTWVVCLNNDIEWKTVRDSFISNGGDGIYGAWQLTYREPMFSTLNLLKREKFIDRDRLAEYKLNVCPNAEYLQPRLMQFKTNYWDLDEAYKQAKILKQTLQMVSV